MKIRGLNEDKKGACEEREIGDGRKRGDKERENGIENGD